MKAFDCVVIGAGPAGSTAATIVAEAGFSTLLLERNSMPREHVGESLMPETYWVLDRLGVLDRLKEDHFRQKVGVQFVSPSGKQSQPFYFRQHDPHESSQTWHVERAAFDDMLFRNAGEKGATLSDGTKVLDVHINEGEPHEVVVKRGMAEPETVTARVVVDATGQQAFLANRLRLRVPNPRLRKAAIWGHFARARQLPPDQPETTTICHTAEKRGWFWYIPLTGDKVSVGLVGDNQSLLKRPQDFRDVFFEEVEKCSDIASRLEDATLVGRLRVDREFSYSTKKHAGDGWVLVGDAYGFIDPAYSTGVLLALKSGELAGDSIAEGLANSDLSAEQLGKWTPDFDRGVHLFRKLVNAFYTREFSFSEFLREHGEHQGNLTDLLVGRAFRPGAGRIFEDLDRFIDAARHETNPHNMNQA